MMIAINIDEKQIKSNLSNFGFLDDLTLVVWFLWATGFSNKSFCFCVGYGVSGLEKKSVCFLVGENLRRSVDFLFGRK